VTTVLARRRRHRRPVAPTVQPHGCTCLLRHPSSVSERNLLKTAVADAVSAGNGYLAGCLRTRLSTPCRTWEPAAALLAGTDWLEGLAATGPLCPCGCGYPPEKHVQQYAPISPTTPKELP